MSHSFFLFFFFCFCFVIDVREWDVDHVATWIEAQGFGRHQFEFRAKKITGAVLLEASRVQFLSLGVDGDDLATLLTQQHHLSMFILFCSYPG